MCRDASTGEAEQPAGRADVVEQRMQLAGGDGRRCWGEGAELVAAPHHLFLSEGYERGWGIALTFYFWLGLREPFGPFCAAQRRYLENFYSQSCSGQLYSYQGLNLQ